MRKLILVHVALLSIFVSNTVLAETGNDLIKMVGSSKSYGCNNTGATYNFADNTYLQTVGNTTLNGVSRGAHKRFKCNASSGNPFYDDHWDEVSIKWCQGSDVNSTGVPGVTYTLYGPDGTSYGSAGAAAANGCLKGVRSGGSSGSGGGSTSGNQKCPTTGGYAQLNAVVDGSCNNTKSVASKLESYENLAEGASCKFKCATAGWYVYLKDGSCKSGYEPSANKRKCVPTVEGNMCRHTGGEWNSGIQQCTCSSSLQLTNDGPTKCKCSKSGYSWDYENKKCVNSSGRSHGEQISVDNTNRSAKQKRDACVASGGSMPKSTCICDAAKFMQVSGGVCTCMSGYERVSAGNPSQGCKITDAEAVKRACTAATNGTWDASTQKCVCNDADYELDVNAQTCKPISALAECQPLMAQNKARWDATNKTCKCTQEGYALEDGECKETAEGAVVRKANEMQTAKSKIENVHSKLKKIQDGFNVSAWKNEDGNFNTARLASDATAGVVLGTAGALITSKIVKKNQIEDGFEDIRCTIGGQSVAGWGDEFSVGSQM